jgi:regulator of RNase E activity RraA
MVGADDDGIVVVPAEIAPAVAVHARAILLADMRARRDLYQRTGLTPDATVDFESVERYFAALPAL